MYLFGTSFFFRKTFSVLLKWCAQAYPLLGHELGHNFGASHNEEQGMNHVESLGHGHLIDSNNTHGYRTIMSYKHGEDHLIMVNHYSNPDVIFPGSGTPTGIEGTSNNALVISSNRFTFAAIGDESSKCEPMIENMNADSEMSTADDGWVDVKTTITSKKQEEVTTEVSSKQESEDSEVSTEVAVTTADDGGWVDVKTTSSTKQQKEVSTEVSSKQASSEVPTEGSKTTTKEQQGVTTEVSSKQENEDSEVSTESSVTSNDVTTEVSSKQESEDSEVSTDTTEATSSTKHAISLIADPEKPSIFSPDFDDNIIALVLGESTEQCCQDSPKTHIDSCTHIEINHKVLLQKNTMLFNPDGKKDYHFSYSNEVAPNGITFHAPDGSEAVLNYNAASGNIYGSITLPTGHWAIEKCKKHHVLKSYPILIHSEDDNHSGIYWLT